MSSRRSRNGGSSTGNTFMSVSSATSEDFKLYAGVQSIIRSHPMSAGCTRSGVLCEEAPAFCAVSGSITETVVVRKIAVHQCAHRLASHFDVHTLPCRNRRCLLGLGVAYRVDPFSADDPGRRCSHSGCLHQSPGFQGAMP
jgi:hypothetical protein